MLFSWLLEIKEKLFWIYLNCTSSISKTNFSILTFKKNNIRATPIGWFGEIDRNGSENLLKDCKVGTFLTRYSQNAQSYVISHVLPDKTIEHMAQIYPIENRRVKVENSKGVFFYTSFVEYIYEGAMSDEYMYCWCPLPSELQFSPKKVTKYKG